ncbi:MAG: PaaI family thioesterase [Pseudomonadota bacterium]
MTDWSYGVCDRETLTSTDGLTFLTGIVEGRLPQPPICQTVGFVLVAASYGAVTFEGATGDHLGNPIGSIHGGFAATLLDSATACAVHATLATGETYTTLELKVNMVRALLPKTGLVRAEGEVIHRGRRIATSDGKLVDEDGRLYAHATSTCLIMAP